MADLEQHLHAIPPALALNPQTQALRSLLEAVALARNSRDGIAALGLLQKVSWRLTLFHGSHILHHMSSIVVTLLKTKNWFQTNIFQTLPPQASLHQFLRCGLLDWSETHNVLAYASVL